MSETAIEVRGIAKRFEPRSSRQLRERLERAIRSVGRRLLGAAPVAERGRRVWAVDDVRLEVAAGTSLALVGGNGAGKSVLLRMLAGVTKPTRGSAMVRGRLGAFLEGGVPLHPELTGRENVFLCGGLMGMSRSDVARRLDDIVDLSGLGRSLDDVVKTYSTGMCARLGLSVALRVDADVLFIDEALGPCDEAFRSTALDEMAAMVAAGRTLVYVSHDLGSIERLCDCAVWMRDGRIVMDGTVPEVLRHYQAADYH
jgi:ABC-type polysaccharide/polyol phosphate transport system ATPase subunit